MRIRDVLMGCGASLALTTLTMSGGDGVLVSTVAGSALGICVMFGTWRFWK